MPYPSDSSRRAQNRPTDLTIHTAPEDFGRHGEKSPVPPLPQKQSVSSADKPPLSARNYRFPAPSAAPRARDSVESFLEDEITTDFNKENEPYYRQRKSVAHRDSHGLSLPSEQFTRDSLVGNMLSSLDQFSLGQIHTPTRAMFDEAEGFGSIRREDYTRTMTSTTSRMHSSFQPSHGYTYSSDYEAGNDRASGQISRGRRSNSSSSFQLPTVRLNSMRERSHPGTTHRRIHSRGGRTSKSSSINSIDAGYAQIASTQRWTQTLGGRAASFDASSQQRPPFASQASGSGWNADVSNTFLVDDYEAAPTPNVPGGPRRAALPIAPVGAPHAPPPPESDGMTSDRERKKGSRSRSGTVKSSASRAASSTRYGNSHSQEMPPPVPAVDRDSAPAPSVGYEKAKDGVPPTTTTTPAPATKEKRGFFSRVFGSARTPAAPNENPAAIPQQSPAETTDRVNGEKLQQPAAVKNQSAPPSRDSPQPQSPHVIQKKPSFFRRRKKSINEPPVPVPPLPIGIDVSLTKDSTGITLPESSPVSSLRQVMNQYLDGAATQNEKALPVSKTDPEVQDEDARRRVRGFSPDYEPNPNATIRTVKSHSVLKTRHSMVNIGRKTSNNSSGKPETSSRVPPDVPAKPTAGNTRDETFFNDSSDEGEQASEAGRKRRSRQDGKARQQSTDGSETPKPEASSLSALQNGLVVNEPSLRNSLVPPMEGSAVSRRPSTSADTPTRPLSTLPSLKIDTAQASPRVSSGDPLDEPEVTMGEPTEDDRQKAQGIYDGVEDFISKEKAASWMGEEGLLRQRTLRAYMELYDFENLSVLSGLRQICGRLVLRGETQQVDRILVAFSQRWCVCNPNHGFKSIDVIHTMCYSIMLLNTDLHLADIENKMTRSQFIKNTMDTITQAVRDSAPNAFDRRSMIVGKDGLLIPGDNEPRPSTEQHTKQSWRASFLAPRSESQMGFYQDSGAEVDPCGPLVKTPFEGTMKAWELQVEIVLKEIYASIRDERLPLFGAEQPATPQVPPQSTLSVKTMLKRSPSVLSKAPSESQVSVRGRIHDPKFNTTGRFTSKSRSRPRIPHGASSSRTSLEDGNSIWSPTMSSATWSRYSLGRTQTSGSMGSFYSNMVGGDYQQSIGFANALSQAIIREDFPMGASSQSVISDETGGIQLLEDETLELCGAPWMKEGMVTHKHHLDAADKKAKERNWTEVFAVIQKGTMSLFSFTNKSMRQKNRKGGKQAGAVVGGGNWQDNATSVGSFSLRQTLATELPSPGYSPSRPHVWALSLPTGAVHLFQVGTPEIAKEFVLTVNYWSARMSTHPLVGGISNIEYGWSDAIINTSLITDVVEASMPPRPCSQATTGRTSIHMHSRQNSRQSSLRSSFDVGSTSRTKLPGDKVMIAEWAPPAQSMRPSNSGEAEQLETLTAYVKSIEDDLQRHNQLRSPMLLTFTPRGHNSAKAMANWERKSSYLLREIVKFRTYVDGLQHAAKRRAEIYEERENARRAARGEDLSDSESEGESDHDGYEDDDEEVEEGDLTLRP